MLTLLIQMDSEIFHSSRQTFQISLSFLRNGLQWTLMDLEYTRIIEYLTDNRIICYAVCRIK